MNSVQISAFVSVFLQFITGFFEAQALFFKVRPEDEIVKDILWMELTVQFIEFLFYLYLVYLILNNDLHANITSHRYIDWFITTPTMLISFVLFFKYLRDPTRNIRWIQSFQEESGNIIKIVIGNALMLLLGFLSERKFINTYVGVTVGFIPFAYVFKILYSNYSKFTNLGLLLHYFSFIVWSLYGVGAILSFNQKNTMYNILDLFAKNTYGLFLYFFLWTKKI